MALTSGQVTVNSAAIQIDGSSSNPVKLHIHNNDNTKSLFLGDKNVTISTGFILLKLDSLEVILNPGESIYAISDAPHLMSFLKQSM